MIPISVSLMPRSFSQSGQNALTKPMRIK